MAENIGMSCAFFSLLFMKIRIEWRAIIYSFLGAIPGVIIGFETVDKILSAPMKKMIFVSVWCSFAMSLYMLNCEKKRITTSLIQNFKPWKIVILIFTGLIGGIFTSFAGSGVDICTFSAVTFLFRVSEKTATPTTVVIMALTSQFCFFYRGLVVADFDPLAFEYFKVCIPVVVFFAPFGSFLGSHFHRITLAWLVCILEIFAMIGFLATLPPWTLLFSAVLIMFCGFILFSLLADYGNRLMIKEAQQNNSKVILLFENC
uniref:Membrane transporter protein n=1 Tax=Panagrolaimus davidi TaxID=227884 RepID=A0A914P933_9BILA